VRGEEKRWPEAKRRPRSELRATGALIPRVLDELGLGSANEALRLLECWESAVGSDVARHCQPLRLRGGVLEARVDTSVWCQQLMLQRGEILAALRRELGAAAPRELRLRVG